MLLCSLSPFRDIDAHARFDVCQSRPEDITLREDFGVAVFAFDDGFG